MDPFSITVGVVGLADAGTSLAGFLTEKYKTYRDAPELILEIAHEVEFCAGLVDMFGSNLDRPGAEYPEKFVRDAKNLVRRTNAVFLDIRGLMPIDRDFDAPFSRARWHFMLDKKKLLEHQQRLRQLQQMFMFMETMYRYHYPSENTVKPSGGAIKDPNQGPDSEEQTLQGVMDSQSPMLLNGVGADGRSFQVTLTLKPVSQQMEAVPYSMPVSAPGISSRSGLSTIKPARSSQSKRRLEGLRRSPFFDMSLLEGDQPRRRKAEATTYEYVEALPASYSRSSRTELEAEELEAKKRQAQSAQQKSGDETQHEVLARRIVDDDEAKRDVDALSKLWFGSEDDSQEDADADDDDALELQPMTAEEQPTTVPFISEPNTSPPSTASREPTYYGAPRDGNTMPPPPTTRYASPTAAPALSQSSSARQSYVSHSSTGQIVCDGCDRDIKRSAPIHHCRSCAESFDLCSHCFANPETTLRHQHPKSHFVTTSAGQ